MKSIVILPARMGSERLPNKPLLKIEGKSMIRLTVEKVLLSGLSPVVVATDSPLIVKEFEGDREVVCVMTSPDHSCGTERVLEAYEKVSSDLGQFDFIINVQGDEPFIDPELLKGLPAELLKRKDRAEFFTTVTELPESELTDRNVAKVVLDLKQNALIFTREPLEGAYKHTSVYIYTPKFLKTFCSLEQTPLETKYRLEQMRALEHGFNLNCIPLPYDAISINTIEDLQKAGIDNFELFT
ncbi:MAG: 3-deoxy-manno-octulosonate cytidylyltransferase [Deltaproteobacteria bacterium]|nr:3-deoxy-manno-octulosonate cytidylyltransferase [Deltaproteobacteria bacterium]